MGREAGSKERARHRIWSRLQVLSCQHRDWHRARIHELWDRDLNQSWTLNQLSHLDVPIHSFFCRVFFNLHVLEGFPNLFFWLFSSFIVLWSENIHSMISISLYLWLSMWSTLENIPYALIRNVTHRLVSWVLQVILPQYSCVWGTRKILVPLLFCHLNSSHRYHFKHSIFSTLCACGVLAVLIFSRRGSLCWLRICLANVNKQGVVTGISGPHLHWASLCFSLKSHHVGVGGEMLTPQYLISHYSGSPHRIARQF